MSVYLVHGLTRSYFTRKVTGYLDYTDRPWRLEPGFLDHTEAVAAGWNGGIPGLTTPGGVPMNDPRRGPVGATVRNGGKTKAAASGDKAAGGAMGDSKEAVLQRRAKAPARAKQRGWQQRCQDQTAELTRGTGGCKRGTAIIRPHSPKEKQS